MITTIKLFFQNSIENIILNNFENKFVIQLDKFKYLNLNSFDIEITFNQEIDSIRTHDYKWKKNKEQLIAPMFTPKIIKLKNGFYVQPNIQEGIWEFNPKYKNRILWRFNPENANWLTKYSGNKNEKILYSAQNFFTFNKEIALLFSDKNALEFSRSPIAFSAVACFTDHCDFDTLKNLKSQRLFFEENKIKVTKGFFLNHFSKRDDNASFENNREELLKWEKDGHELCYHSLSQSIKNSKISFEDFKTFKPPIKTMPTWIDHGYQPYNLSLFQNSGIEEKNYVAILKKNNIQNLWNYIDSGTSTLGVINQLNSNDFTLKSYFEGIKNLDIKDKIALKIKIILFHFYADELMIMKYKSLSKRFKKFVINKNIKELLFFLKNLISIIIPLLKVFLFWNSVKNKPFKLAKYSPLVFKHKIQDSEFNIFQTIEMVDFKKSLHKKNIDKLIEEKGLFIAHTYFSVPMEYHFGKLFKSPSTIDQEVAQNFSYLSKKIQDKSIWNPSLNELILFINKFETITLDLDKSGKIFNLNQTDLPFREIY